MALNPLKEYKSTPVKVKVKFEEGRIQTPDGASLAFWYFPSARITNKLIIVSHNGDGNMGNNLSRIKSLLSFGFNVLCYDYRGFGASSAFVIEDETYLYAEFYSDFEAVYNYAVENYGKKLYLYGWGIGATITNTIGYNKPNTYTIISDGSVNKFPDLPSKFMKIGSRMKIAAFLQNSYKDPFSTFRGTPSPNLRAVLLIIGSDDLLFTKEDMDELNGQLKNLNSQVYILPNKRSWDNYRSDPSTYMRQVHMFLVNN